MFREGSSTDTIIAVQSEYRTMKPSVNSARRIAQKRTSCFCYPKKLLKILKRKYSTNWPITTLSWAQPMGHHWNTYVLGFSWQQHKLGRHASLKCRIFTSISLTVDSSKYHFGASNFFHHCEGTSFFLNHHLGSWQTSKILSRINFQEGRTKKSCNSRVRASSRSC